VHELNDSYSGFSRSASQRSTLRSTKVDWDSHDGLGENKAAGLSCSSVLSQVPQDYSDNVGWIKRLPLDMKWTIPAKRHLRRSDKPMSNRGLHRIEMLTSLPSYDYVCAAIPHDGWMRSVVRLTNK
jgi:hypothetical protein